MGLGFRGLGFCTPHFRILFGTCRFYKGKGVGFASSGFRGYVRVSAGLDFRRGCEHITSGVLSTETFHRRFQGVNSVAEWMRFTLFWDNTTHYKTESVHFLGLMNSATE